MNILGISAFYHDSAACLINQGRIMAAAQEERFTRIKNDPSFPTSAVRFCLQQAKISAQDLDAVVFYEKPFVKLDRIIETYLAVAPAGFRSFRSTLPLWMRDKLNIKGLLIKHLCHVDANPSFWRSRLRFSEHHLSHAASAFYPSPFAEAAVITLDGSGEWCTGSLWKGNGTRLEPLADMRFPHSLGLLYSAFTQYLGFRVNEGEYKVMGLAAYGIPRHVELIRSRLISIKEDGSFHLDMSYFDFTKGLAMTNTRFHALFGGPPRENDAPITPQHHDIASSIQKITEELILLIARKIKTLTQADALCLAGGVALNCSANGVLQRSNIFRDVWVQPAAGDAGGALGAALAYWYLCGIDRERTPGHDRMQGARLGPAFTEAEIITAATSHGLPYTTLCQEETVRRTARALADGKIIGWMQGRAEFGPRALGARSILASASDADMQEKVNRKIKKRESFRPFAPAVLAEKANDWFTLGNSPYMLFTCETRSSAHRGRIPAVVHVDGTSRIQTVSASSHPVFHQLLCEYEALTGVPVLLNTSFNVKDEPIVHSPDDALRCMKTAGLDMLVMENVIVEGPQQLGE